MTRARARSAQPLLLAFLVLAPLAGAGGAASAADPLPDLAVVSVDVADGAWSPPGFGPVPPRAVTILVKNVGAAPAPEAIVEFAVIRPDGLRDVLAGFQTFPLAPDSEETFRTEWAPHPDRVGDYDLVATVDPRDRVEEADPFNNAAHARAANAPVKGVLYPARALSDDPVQRPAALAPWARYAFDRFDAGNPAPGLLLDRAGHGRDARLPAGVPVDVPGLEGRARAFTGGAWLRAPFPDAPQASLAFWVRADAGAAGALLATDAPACERAVLALEAGGALTWHAPAPAPACATREPVSATVPADAWTHVTVVAARDVTLVYVDGEVALARPSPGSATGLRAPGLFLATAPTRADPIPASTLHGASLDEALVFDRALTPVEVAILAGNAP